ncbi:MAG: hypothetical protein J6A21_08220 [Lentisphaeria bacterium]|nr:hypothetical protein [Lentisphaeria bacterium]
MDFWNTEKILSLFREAARLGLKIKKDPHTVLKEDATPVTLADKTIEDFLTGELAGKDAFLVGEETFASKGREYLDRALSGTCWIIDPVDGTANFAASYDTWGISIGFAKGGRLVQGGVYLPEKGELVLTDGERVLYAQHPGMEEEPEWKNFLKPLEKPGKPFTGASVVSLSQLVAKKGIVELPNPVLATGSFVYSAVSVALGRDGALVTNAKLWDVAGMVPCFARLGIRGGFLGDREKDVTDCRIDPEYYFLDYTAQDAFRLKDAVLFVSDFSAAEKIRSACRVEYTLR